MRQLFIFTLFSLLLFTACNKEVAQRSLRFEGKVIHAITQAPLGNVQMKLVYGPTCCGGIDQVIDSTSTKTDADGNYAIDLTYSRDTTFVRHMVAPEGWPLKYRPLPQTLTLPGPWHTYQYSGPYAVPDAVTDTLLDNRVTTNTFQVIEGAALSALFEPATIPSGTVVLVEVYSTCPLSFQDTQGNHSSFSFYEGLTLSNRVTIPLIAGYQNTLVLKKTDLNGNVLSEKEYQFQPSQSQVIEATINYD